MRSLGTLLMARNMYKCGLQYLSLCVTRVTCLFRRFMQNKRLSIRRLTPIVHLQPILGRHVCAVEDSSGRVAPTEVSQEIKGQEGQSSTSGGSAVARSDRFTGYQPYLASSRYYIDSSSLLRVGSVTGTPGRISVSFRQKIVFTRLPQ